MNEPRNDNSAPQLALTDHCPEYVLVQYHGTDDPSDSEDYSHFPSRDAAWEAEKGEEWVRNSGMTLENCRYEFMDTLIETDRNGVLQAAREGQAWPFHLGFALPVPDHLKNTQDDTGPRFALTERCPEYVLVEVCGIVDDPYEGLYVNDYSHHGSREAAWEAERQTPEVHDDLARGMSLEKIQREFLGSLIETDREGALRAAQAGDRWPIASGFVREVSELEVLQEENRRLRTKFGAAQEQIVALRAALEDAHTSWAMEVAELRDGNDIVSETDSAGGWGAASDLENALDDRRPGNRNPSPH